jgi:glycosyltransferase involved in cell wall biosynthesis
MPTCRCPGQEKAFSVHDLIVHHFGPDSTTVGGIATVIRVSNEHQVGGDFVDAHSTWLPRSPLVTAWRTVASTRTLLQIPAGQVAHVHLSERGSFVREGSLVALAHRHGLVTVVTIHAAEFFPFANRYRSLVSAVLRRADFIICMDQEVLDFVRLNAPDVLSKLIPNPVFVDDEPFPADRTGELVVFAGEIGLRKGADVLYRAWRLVAQRRPKARCLMVGPVTDFTPSSSERLELRAAVEPREMLEILRSARVIALPSRAEGMPMVLTEAMSVGRPFVSTPVGGIPELASAGGLLVPIGDELTLADRLTELLADPGLARRIGERGRRFCSETRGVEVIDARLRRLYSAAAEIKRSGRGAPDGSSSARTAPIHLPHD